MFTFRELRVIESALSKYLQIGGDFDKCEKLTKAEITYQEKKQETAGILHERVCELLMDRCDIVTESILKTSAPQYKTGCMSGE